MNSSSHAVKYESAAALMNLSAAPTAVKGAAASTWPPWVFFSLVFNTMRCEMAWVSSAAASCYVNLVLKESDNNVKLIVLDRINELRQKHGRVLDDLVMDILRVLSRYTSLPGPHRGLVTAPPKRNRLLLATHTRACACARCRLRSPDLEVRRKCIRIALEMVSSRNVNDVIAFLKKELARAGDEDFDKVRWRACAHALFDHATCSRIIFLFLRSWGVPSPPAVGRVPPPAGPGCAPVRDPVPGGRRVRRPHPHGLFGRLALRVCRRRHHLCSVRRAAETRARE